MINLSGIFPPLPTSFGLNDELLPDKMKENLLALNKYSLSGYLILGSNGELVNLTEAEKVTVYQAAREAIPSNRIMIAGTGGQSTGETIRLTQAAAAAGADAALILNPSYYKGLMSKRVLVSHYHEVAEAATIPVIIYNMPANSGLDMDGDTLIEISNHPNIIGLKDSGGDLTKMALVIKETKEDFQVLAGSAGFLLPALSIGAVGGILALANIAPQACLNIFSEFENGDWKQAARQQREVIRLNSAVTRAWGVPALKAAMNHLGLYGGPCRKPIESISEKQLQDLIQIISTMGL